MTIKFSTLLAALALVVSCTAQIYTGVAAEPAIEAAAPAANNDFITQTVYGFLDFTTTIANTVMVFSPQSAPPEGSREAKSSSIPAIETKPTAEKKNPDIQPSKTHKNDETKKDKTKIVVNSVVEQNVVNHAEETKSNNGKATTTHVEVVTKSPVLSTLVEVRPKDDVPGVKNNLAEPEYDFLSKQPTEVVDETYKVINLRPSAKSAGSPKPRPSAPRRDKENPTGLVTKLGGTIVKDGLTTVHETNVIGTYINGKYAQVLQSSSRIINNPSPNNVEGNNNNKIKPTNSQRILKTLGPQHGKHKHQQQLESSAGVQNDEPQQNNNEQQGFGNGRPGRRHPGNAARPKFRNKIVDEPESNNESQQQQQNRPGKNRPAGSRPGYKNRAQQQQPTTTTEPTTGGTRRRAGFRPSNSGSSNTNPAKQYKSTKTEQSSLALPNPSIKSKLPRTQGRWSYKTTPKPRINIRKQAGDDEPKQSPTSAPLDPNVSTQQSVVTNSGPPQQQQQLQQPGNPEELPTPISQRKIQEGDFDGELDESESEDVINVSVQQQQVEGAAPQPTERILPIETINVEISTPADFNDIYFEIATIKSPYEFQVGTSRNTRYVTVTSTIKKSFATAEPSTSPSPTEPLTENILANTGAAYETSLPLDSSIATLPAITLEPSQATPPLETITEVFSTTQALLKTHVLPVIANGNTTTRLTLVQTYNIQRIVTATKTLPPPEIYQFVPSKTLNEFNSKLDEAGSELHLELDFGDDERDDEDIPKRIVAPSSDLDSDLDIFKSINPTSRIKNEPSTTSAVTEPAIKQDQAQLALLKLLGQQGAQVITTSRPVVVLETVYESHVVPLVSAGNTIFSTISRPVATVPRTSYEYGTSTITPPLLPPQVPQIPQIPPAVPFLPQAQPQFTVTSAPIIQQTIATVSDSRVLKLTFGAKTAYTTLFSTRLVPTELTTYVTSTIALQPTVPAFPGYYPQPVGFPGFPYVG